MDVYQNGVLLKPGTDYTATTGTTVVLVTGASLNDVVEMVVYDTFLYQQLHQDRGRYTLSIQRQQQHHPLKWSDH
jgi:hypothetical protein